MDVNDKRGSEKWQKFAENSTENSDFKSIWELSSNYHEAYVPNNKIGLEKLRNKIRHEKTNSSKIIRLSPNQKIMRIAAVAVILLVASFFAYQSLFVDNLIVLASGEQKLEAIELPDGSTIWLNKNSELHHPATFSETERKVILKGEAFFDIAKDANKPFIIQTPYTQTKVLGTSFNIRCFEEEGIDEIQVLTGKVNFSTLDKTKETDLTANEKVVFDVTNNSFTKEPKKDMNALAWKTGQLQYKDVPLSEVMLQLEKTFHVRLDVTKLHVLSCAYSGNFQDAEIDHILAVLKTTFGFEVKEIHKNNYRLLGGSC